MARVDARLRNVRAWNGIPGVDIPPDYAQKLIAAGVPVNVFVAKPAHMETRVDQVGHASWGANPADDLDVAPVADRRVEVFVPEEKGYRLAVPLARLAPDVHLTIWAAQNHTPDELGALYKMQEGDWATYLHELRAEMEGKPASDEDPDVDPWLDFFKE